MILLDTHAWIWWVDSPDRLGPKATAAISKAHRDDAGIHVSCISTWEVHMLAAKGRLSLAIPVDVWVARCEKLGFLRFQPLNNEIARLAVTHCASMHADPADRIIVATALYLGASVVTLDDRIRKSGLVRCLG